MNQDHLNIRPAYSCAIIKTSGLFASKPIKHLPQTNLIHGKKIKKTYTDPSVRLKRAKYLFYQINAFTKVKVSYDLKKFLDKLIAKNPRCKIFRDLYHEEDNLQENDIIFSYAFTLDSEHPICTEIDLYKKLFDLVIISNKTLLVFSEKDTCIDNENMIIFNTLHVPVSTYTPSLKTLQKFEYNFIDFSALAGLKTQTQFQKFRPRLMRRKPQIKHTN